MVQQERRTAQRFDTKLPIIVRWTDGLTVGQAHTTSRDVSSSGIYFCLPREIENGESVEIIMTLPNEVTLAGPIYVRCVGRVQRSETLAQGGAGVAAHIERYEFLRQDANAA